MRPLDLVNRRFGSLTALTPVMTNANKRGWDCRCDCGNLVTIPTGQLTSGNNISCGCSRSQQSDLTGQKIGQLTVIARGSRDSKNRRWQWECECSCGNRLMVFTRYLQRGSKQDCGKCVPRVFNRGKPNGEALFNALISDYQRNAQVKGHCFDLTKEQARTLFQQPCFYCGNAPSRLFKKSKIKSQILVNGIDRMNNTQGYTTENSVACCFTCNMMKRDLPFDSFISIVTKISNNIRIGMGKAREPNT